MLVSHRYRFIYLKTRKTAGSSVELAFEPFARPEGWQPEGGEVTFATEEMVSEAGIVGARTPEPKKRARYKDHMPARQVRKAVPPHVWRSYFKFCTIRNPWDKVVSFFHFTHKDLKDQPQDLIVERFRNWVDNGRHARGHDRSIYWIGKRPVTDGYVRYHRLEEDAQAVADHLGLGKLPPIGGVHTGFRNAVVPWTDYYDDASREAVAEVYADEIAHFGWVFDNSVEIRVPSFTKPRKRFFGFLRNERRRGEAATGESTKGPAVMRRRTTATVTE